MRPSIGPRYRRGIAASPSCARRCGLAPCSPCSWRTRSCELPFSAQPTIQPSDGLPASAPSRPLLARMVASPTLVTGRISRASSWLRLDTGSTPRRSRSTKSICCIGIDAQIAGQPELVDAAADVAVAVVEQVDIFLHALGPDAPGDLLIDRHGGHRDRRAQRVVLVPGLDAARHAVPLEDVLVGVLDHAGLQRDDRIRNLEGRGRQLALARAHLVAGDDQIIVDLVADEGACRAEIEKPLGQIVAKLAALVGDIGEDCGRARMLAAARRPSAWRRLITVVSELVEEGRDDADGIVEKL